MKSIKIVLFSLVLVLLLMSPNLLFAAVPDYDSPVTYWPNAEDPRGLTTGDFNGDGFLDLATGNSYNSTISVFINNGDGAFQDAVLYDSGGDSYGITSSDFNGDGKIDLAVANFYSENVAVLLGNGDGTFNDKVTYMAEPGARFLLAVDLNSDDKVDLACANYDDNTVSVYIGIGDGTFQSRVSYTTDYSPRVLTSGDFNNDSKVDLIALNNSADDFSVFLGNGDGTFQDKIDILTGETPRSIASADFNKDGNLDVVTANVWTDDISVLLGKGDGTFQPRVNYTMSLGNYINIGDYNGDSWADIVLTGTDINDTSKLLIVFFINNGDGTFTREKEIDFSAYDRPYWLVSSDLNNDGYLDLATTNYSDALNVFMKHTDDTGPTVAFSPEAPADGSVINGNVNIPVYATDESGIQKIGLFDNLVELSTVFTDSYTFSVDTSTLVDGAHVFKVEAYDNIGNTSYVEINYIVDNTNPSVDAGTDKTVNGQFNQDATASDTGGIATYQWSKQSGPGTVAFGTPNAEDTTVNADQDGTYVARLTVTDNAGNQSFDEFTFIRDTANPIVDAGTDKTVNGQFNQDAAASDTSGIGAYQWSKQSGPGTVAFGTPNAEDTTVNADQDGTYIARLTVTDNAGNQSFDEFTFIRDQVAPTATSIAAPIFSTDVSTSTGFSVNWLGTDDNSGVAEYQLQYHSHLTATWSIYKVDGNDWTANATAKFTIGKPGYTYYFRVRPKDKAGNIGSWSTIKRTVIPFDNASLKYSSAWKSAISIKDYKNTLKYSGIKDAFASFVFTGKALSLIAPKAGNRGIVDVYIKNKVNGVWSSYSKIKSVDLYSGTAKSRVPIAIKSWTSASAHQVKFVATGKKNTKSKGTRIDIDGIGVLN